MVVSDGRLLRRRKRWQWQLSQSSRDANPQSQLTVGRWATTQHRSDPLAKPATHPVSAQSAEVSFGNGCHRKLQTNVSPREPEIVTQRSPDFGERKTAQNRRNCYLRREALLAACAGKQPFWTDTINTPCSPDSMFSDRARRTFAVATRADQPCSFYHGIKWGRERTQVD